MIVLKTETIIGANPSYKETAVSLKKKDRVHYNETLTLVLKNAVRKYGEGTRSFMIPGCLSKSTNYYFLGATPHGFRDLSSPTRD